MTDKGSFSEANFLISGSIDSTNLTIVDWFRLSFKGTAHLLCTSGSARIQINSRMFRMEAPSVFIMLPHFYQFELLEKTEDFSYEYTYYPFGFGIGTYAQHYSGIWEKIETMPVLAINEEEMKNLLTIHSFILWQYDRQDHHFRIENIRVSMSVFISEFNIIYSKREIPAHLTNRREELINKFFYLIYTHHKEERKITFYAENLCLSPKYLSRRIKKTTGQTIPFWIDKFVMLSAKIALQSTGKTVLQISEELNFPNPSFFGSFFKKHERMTPVRYRDSVSIPGSRT